MLGHNLELHLQSFLSAVPLSSASAILFVTSTIIAVILSRLLYNLLQPGLVGIPGPFAAKFTDLWRLYKIWQWRFKEDLPSLHEAYNSPLIRVGPKMVSCSDPRAVEVIYGFHTGFKKVSLVICVSHADLVEC